MKQNKQASKPLFSSIDIEKQAPSIDESHWRVLLVLYIHVSLSINIIMRASHVFETVASRGSKLPWCSCRRSYGDTK